jgi:transposase
MRAWELYEVGWSRKDIAEALKVSAAVSGWLKRARQSGIEALRRHPAPGPTPNLTAEQRGQLPDLLAKGAETYALVGQVWTTKCVAALIKRVLSVSYHPTHVSRLLRQEGLRLQKPIGVPVSGMRPRSRRGGAKPGPPFKKSLGGGTHDPRRRRGGLLSAAVRGVHLCPRGANAHPARPAHARSPRRD